MTTAELSRPKGRPKGSKTKQLPIVEIVKSRCPKCHSTERSHYFGVKTRQSSGISPHGNPFNYVSRKRTFCRNCGQARIDVLYENVI